MGKDLLERERGPSAREDDAALHLLILLLAPDQACADQLTRTLCDRVESEDIRIEVVSQLASDAVAHARRKFGGIPLGFVADDEVTALEALTQGADEVLVWPPRDDASVQGFFDRTKLRASLRRGQERLSASVAHTEKLTALGTLVAGVAHEINNPLTVLQFGVEACSLLMSPLSQMAQEVRIWASRGWGASPEDIRALHERAQTGAPPHEGKQLLEEMLTAAGSIASIVRDLRVFARSDSEREEPRLLDANDVADQALRLVGRQISAMARVERDYARDLPQVLAPHGRLTQVLINVLVNALHAIDEVERPAHRVRVVTRTDGESVAVSISDTGPGIPPHALDHIFDPFFTTKRAGYGTGLGLSISRSIMHELGGDMIVESVHGSGATFILLLPIPDSASVRKAYLRNSGAPPLPTTAGQRRTVLLVDDDERVLGAYARALGRSFDVLMAADGREAIDLLMSGSSADALISELALPQVDGRELYEWLQREQPALARRTIFVSAEPNLQRYQSFVGDVQARVLVKPVTTNALVSALTDALLPAASSGSRPPPA
ncbi:MAG TPA: ATP-binding protein [Polyangiaceae bacterium]|nr:ATP-binding protein [Polyangiaceae bacterium]